jgi:hypothetical protein
MSDELNANSQTQPAKAKRPYNRKQPTANPIPQVNPNVAALESGLIPLVNQRLEANQIVRIATQKANQANFELQNAQNSLAQIEGEINYRMQMIQQLKGGAPSSPAGPFAVQPLQPAPQPSPYYAPVTPFPGGAAAGVGSLPAPNIGLYPDASPRGFMETDPERLVNSANASDFMTQELRAQFEGRR